MDTDRNDLLWILRRRQRRIRLSKKKFQERVAGVKQSEDSVRRNIRSRHAEQSSVMSFGDNEIQLHEDFKRGEKIAPLFPIDSVNRRRTRRISRCSALLSNDISALISATLEGSM